MSKCLVLAVVLSSMSSMTRAAEIEVHNGAIEIRGEIVKGDSARFKDAIAKAGANARIELRSSPGGDLREAMAIGTLIRKLMLSTHIAIEGKDGPIIGIENGADGAPRSIQGTDQDALCASACYFIWVAGVWRFGDYLLIVHRPYFDPAEFAQLDLVQAQSAYANLEEEAYSYLKRMGTPQSVIDLMRRTSSGDGARLDPEFVDRKVRPLSPDIDEWLRAKCGSYPEPAYSRFKAAFQSVWEEGPSDIIEEATVIYSYAEKNGDEKLRGAAGNKIKCVGETIGADGERAWIDWFLDEGSGQ